MPNLKVMLVSRQEINIEQYLKIKDSIVKKEIPPLDYDESYDLIISNCKRSLLSDLRTE